MIPIVYFADQLLKFTFLKHLTDYTFINRNLAFSIRTQFISAKWLSLATLVAIIYLAAIARKKINQNAAFLVIAGAASNFVDRLVRGGVVDFINLKIWPSFNLADIAITIGLVWIVMGFIFRPLNSQQSS